MECLLSLILSLEDKYMGNINEILDIILLVVENQNNDWNLRKVSLDVVYSIVILMPIQAKIFKSLIINILSKARFDKVFFYI